ISPYGVLDLAGNVMEWTDTIPSGALPGERSRTVRGASWETSAAEVVDYVPLENSRAEHQRWPNLGFRCVMN
ncbi:MAG TPA: SUMF1/EgtB/PvdO family nonheme iron enzyme, partial [Kofleriaceae bacterium]